MLRSLFTGSLTIGLMASCTASTSSPVAGGGITPQTNPPVAHASDEGGVDGGGGGTLPAQPISIFDVQQVVAHAKKDLVPLIKSLQNDYGQGDFNDDTYQVKIFGGSSNLFDVMETTDIELETTKPCKDAYGNDVDGSIHASRPGAICISAFRIAPKLIEERARIEIEALIAHELSHLLGTTEPEARAFQRRVAGFLEINDTSVTKMTGDKYCDGLVGVAEPMSTDVYNLTEHFDSMSDADLAKFMDKLTDDQTKFYTAALSFPFWMMNFEETAYYNLMSARINVANSFAQIAVTPHNDYYDIQLTREFNGADSVTLTDYLVRNFESSIYKAGPYANEVITKIHNRAELKAFLQNLSPYLQTIVDAAYAMRAQTRPDPMLPPAHASATPFAQFVGRYSVTNRQCTGNPGGFIDTAFSIELSASGNQYHLIEFWGGPGSTTGTGYGDEGGLYNGAPAPVLAGAAIMVDGGTSWAERTQESGDLWNQVDLGGWNQIKIRMEKTAQGYTMTKTTNWADNGQTGTGQCVMTLDRTGN